MNRPGGPRLTGAARVTLAALMMSRLSLAGMLHRPLRSTAALLTPEVVSRAE